MNDTEFWIWLQHTLGIGARLDAVLKWFGTPRNLYEAGRKEWILSGLIDELYIDRLAKYSPSECYKVINSCRDNGWSIITPESDDYPKMLREIPNYPAVLYAWGKTDFLEEGLCIGVVGTRYPTRFGLDNAKRLVGELTDNDCVIVSGGALGIDSCAHKTCIDHGGNTVLVLGCGLGYNYLPENKPMRQLISQNGAVISEYPPFARPNGSSFVLRNRIISGMSRGVLVIEAGEKSGSLNTAHHAKVQGRDVYAVPGTAESEAYQGANRLLREGARPAFFAEDILAPYSFERQIKQARKRSKTAEPFMGIDEFPGGKDGKEAKKHKKAPKTKREQVEIEQPAEENQNKNEINLDNLSQNANIVYNILIMGKSEMMTDDIVAGTSLSTQAVLSALVELELLGAIQSHGAGRYGI